MKVQVIVPAAGSGSRLKSRVLKPLVLLRGKPLLAYCLEIFQQSSLIDSIIVVGPRTALRHFERLIKSRHLTKVRKVVAGGDTRSRSVAAGLRAVDKDTDLVMVHDAARPLVTSKMIADSLYACRGSAAAVVAVPVKPTIKQVAAKGSYVAKTLDRGTLWEAQTPQTFRRDILIKAHRQAQAHLATDDAALVERQGQRVKIVPGDYRNIKITTPEDLILAEALVRKGKS